MQNVRSLFYFFFLYFDANSKLNYSRLNAIKRVVRIESGCWENSQINRGGSGGVQGTDLTRRFSGAVLFLSLEASSIGTIYLNATSDCTLTKNPKPQFYLFFLNKNSFFLYKNIFISSSRLLCTPSPIHIHFLSVSQTIHKTIISWNKTKTET